MTGRERFLAACRCRTVDRPPIWLMRQAGRALPEYRALRQRYSFLDLVRTPELAAEVTLQPVRRFGFDAAILFSDILVANEGLGQGYRFRDEGGIAMDFAVKSARDLERLEVARVRERLAYLPAAVRCVREGLGDQTALLGFAGAPWTLANFALEGGSAEVWERAKRLWFEEPALYEALLERLTRAVTEVLRMQIEAGVDAVQVFDSLAGELPAGTYAEAGLPWLQEVVRSVAGRVPVIVFARGYHGDWSRLIGPGVSVVGVDWQVELPEVAARLPAAVGVQGNLDPFLLTLGPAVVRSEAGRLLGVMGGRPGWIFNLGHGVPPAARLDSMEALVQTVREFAGTVSADRLSS
ncbi:uroporphyrinogen decarboxylase [Limisphaera ngatamarikiensis]|jgi:uroporphyrinogen decarboxylase|uniref:Uroporphyrinogen decarboxylase n=1 Tax=Limisphaera ngatamarikiensis TaxID=1324935 RepID=A0A6M1RVG3_9BACT|nr:uroporphyrinogen decarboxylase [Limisphaera ngatamarikiensis]NGO39401.1 uroporphyrinogen decarboxylase [Limisphaera ngatamarikiensis]